MGFLSLIPAILAIALCFITRNTVISIAIACIVGTLLAGQGVFGFPALLRTAVGTTDFAGVMLLNIFVGILVAYFQKAGAIQGFSQKLNDRHGRQGGLHPPAFS